MMLCNKVRQDLDTMLNVTKPLAKPGCSFYYARFGVFHARFQDGHDNLWRDDEQSRRANTVARGRGYSRNRDDLRREWRSNHGRRSEEHTSELQSLMRISYAVFCLKKKHQPNYINIKL